MPIVQLHMPVEKLMQDHPNADLTQCSNRIMIKPHLLLPSLDDFGDRMSNDYACSLNLLLRQARSDAHLERWLCLRFPSSVLRVSRPRHTLQPCDEDPVCERLVTKELTSVLYSERDHKENLMGLTSSTTS